MSSLHDAVCSVKKYGIRMLFWKGMMYLGCKRPDKINQLFASYYKRLSEQEREMELKQWYYKCTGQELHLDNPRTFNEKIQWMKLYDSSLLKTQLADKYQIRAWIKDQIGDEYLVPLVGSGCYACFDEIDFSQFPKKFVLKTSNACGTNLIVKDKDKLNLRKAKKMFDRWMSYDFGASPVQEWHYQAIPKRIIAEEYIETRTGDLPDYKVYCFNGKPTYIQLISGRYQGNPRHVFMNTEWQRESFSYEGYEPSEMLPERPALLQEMISLSAKLSKPFAFVRVDWYIVEDKKLYFGEMTFTPASGVRHWVPEGTDEKLGKMIQLPLK